jgi:hypothetical protein
MEASTNRGSKLLQSLLYMQDPLVCKENELIDTVLDLDEDDIIDPLLDICDIFVGVIPINDDVDSFFLGLYFLTEALSVWPAAIFHLRSS